MKQIFVLVILLGLFFPGTIYAASESIQSFDSKIILSEDGNMNLTEAISYDFSTNSRHGIIRIIPIYSDAGEGLTRRLRINVLAVSRDNQSENYTLSDNGSNVTIKIGKADQTITGVHQYKISYQIGNSIANFDDHDELYWNATGNDWQVPIESASAEVTTNFGAVTTQVKCFSGLEGEKGDDCSSNNAQSSASFKSGGLPVGGGLTIVSGFPAKTFPLSVYSSNAPYSTQSQPIEIPAWVGWVTLLGVATYYLLLPIGLISWYFRTHHKSRLGKVSVNFDLPKVNNSNLSPAETGGVDNSLVEQNDVVATIFDLAIRKFLKIEEIQSKNILGVKTKKYSFIKLKKDPSELLEHELIIYDRLFQDGDSCLMDDLNDDFYLTFDKFTKSVFTKLVDRGLYKKNPTGQQASLRVLAIPLLLFGFNIPLSATLLWLSFKLNGRTPLGDETDWKVDGLKIFLKNMKREYKWQADNLITVEKYIPYAIAVGLIDQFMDQLKILYPNYHPSWYSGNAAFYTIYPALHSSMRSNFPTESPQSLRSGSSGFSGGSSGGGGGGGGGGSW